MPGIKAGLMVSNQQFEGVDMVSALEDQYVMVRLARDRGWDSYFTGQHYLNEGGNQGLQMVPYLARLAAEIPFVFFSSDLVFDGQRGNYDEAATPNPLSIYAETKIAAEQIVLANPRHTVIRTSLNGGTSPTGDRGFNEELRRAWQAGRSLSLFTDEFRCPLPAVVTARAAWELVERNATGLFHICGAERLSRYQIGQLLAARWPQLNPQITPGSLREYRGAPRPPDCSLNCAKVQRLLSFPLPGLGAWLAAHPQEIY